MEKYILNNGMEIPVIGFGCYNEKGGDNLQMIKDAIDSGYNFFDTASLYETERALGQAIKEKNADREKLFIQSKLWIDEMGYDNAKEAIKRSLDRLQMDYLDVYLIHWPRQNSTSKSEEWKALQEETYRAMEEMVEDGLIKAIGLSNFLPHHLDNILSFCKIKPVVDQIEYHLGYTQERARSYAEKNGIRVQAWSPLGRGALFNDNSFNDMASKYGVTLSQLALRFIYQSGVILLPKSTTPERQKQNLDIFSFEIEADDFNYLACRPNTMWLGEHPDIAIPSKKSNFNQ